MGNLSCFIGGLATGWRKLIASYRPPQVRMDALLNIAKGFRAQGNLSRMEAALAEALEGLAYVDESEKVGIYMRIAKIGLGLRDIYWGV